MVVSLKSPGAAPAGTVTVSVMLHVRQRLARLLSAVIRSAIVQPFDGDVKAIVKSPAAEPVFLTVCWKVALAPGQRACDGARRRA